MNWGMQESESTHVTASAALTTKRHNVQIARIARDGEGSKVRLRVKGRVPLVALFLATKTNIRCSVKRGQPWPVMLW